MDSDAAQEQERKGGEDESENIKLRMSALDRLEKASEDSLFGQGLKVLDNSVETFTFGAWSLLGNAWKGSSRLVSRYGVLFLHLRRVLEKGPVNQQADKEEIEEVTFDRKKAKLLAEQKSLYNAKLLQVQQFFSLGTIVEENGVDPDIGNVIETTAGDNDTEMKRLCDSSVKRAADIAAG
ncbi:hypothetical protein BHM03_00026934 [Ensete ventricosum]|nr:hypothetical protein BHM03_00026934 [Ensete ventricosum]